MHIVHVGYRHISTSVDVVICHENSGHRSREDRVAAKESKELLRGCEDLPRNPSPCTDECRKDRTSKDVDILGAESYKVVCCADGIGRDVDAEGENDQANRAKSSSGSSSMRPRSLPVIHDHNGIPDNMAISWFCCRSCGNAEQTDNSEDERNHKGLHVLRTGLVRVTGEISDVQAECSVVAQNGVEIGEEGPDEGGAVLGDALRSDSAVADGTASLVQR